MVDHQEHFERKFYLDKKTGYWISTDHPRIRAHQWVWLNHHSVIPNGYHIHHKNENKSDNRIDNLELIEKHRHMKYHMDQRMNDPKYRKKIVEQCEKIRPLTKAWHSSPEGIEWHRQHAIDMKFGNGDPIRYDCQHCGKEYFSKLKGKENTKFCSNNCKSASRRKEGKDIVSRKCAICYKDFSCNKYNKTKTCGRACGASLTKITKGSN
jgi:hypothetical protein